MKDTILEFIRLEVRNILEEKKKKLKKNKGGRPLKDPESPIARVAQKAGGFKELAKRSKLSPEHLRNVARGTSNLSLKGAVDISKATHGELTLGQLAKLATKED